MNRQRRTTLILCAGAICVLIIIMWLGRRPDTITTAEACYSCQRARGRVGSGPSDVKGCWSSPDQTEVIAEEAIQGYVLFQL